MADWALTPWASRDRQIAGSAEAILTSKTPAPEGLHVTGRIVATVVSAAAGAIVALLPVMVLGLVTLVYNSAGVMLIFLGSLINLLPLSP